MGLAAKKETERNAQRFTYADYLTWNDDERWELIDGKAYNMSPTPLRIHQEISMDLSRQFAVQLLKKKCRVYAAPFEVRLPIVDESENNISNVVQPDISVICDEKKLDEKGCIGAPDLIIEILSPSTRRLDRIQKRNLYEIAGVKEYWMVDPKDQLVEVFIMEQDGSYGKSHIYTETDTIQPKTLENITIDLSSVLRKDKD